MVQYSISKFLFPGDSDNRRSLKRKGDRNPTCHAKRSPQAGGELAGVVVSEFHPPNSDDLADEANLFPFQILAAKVLER